jgi:hypothetical protein
VEVGILLDVLEVRQDLVIVEPEPVADHAVLRDQVEARGLPGRALEEPDDGLDGVDLVVEVGIEVEFHRLASQSI